jgi:hypothetical protein
MSSYTVRIVFQKGQSNEYIFPVVYALADPEAGGKDVVIKGNRADGSIVIPAGKRSNEISIKGIIMADDYVTITSAMSTMKTKVDRNLSTLTLEHLVGASWTQDWVYTVRRIEEIRFEESLRTDSQKYEVLFLVISYS